MVFRVFLVFFVRLSHSRYTHTSGNYGAQ